jgi:hypothetical protein
MDGKFTISPTTIGTSGRHGNRSYDVNVERKTRAACEPLSEARALG